jgi:hypothetical protein
MWLVLAIGWVIAALLIAIGFSYFMRYIRGDFDDKELYIGDRPHDRY